MAKPCSVLFLFLLLLSSCSPEQSGYAHSSRGFFRLSTYTTVHLYTQKPLSRKERKRIFQGADSLLADWDRRYSPGSSNSVPARINAAEGDTLTLAPSTYDMITQAKKYAPLTEGKFDLTLLPLKEFWHPSRAEQKTPFLQGEKTARSVQQLMKHTGMDKITCIDSNRIIREHDSLRLDLGGVVKSFVIADLARYLSSRGISHFLIAAGGDIHCRGGKPDGTPFTVGVQAPRPSSGNYLDTLQIKSGSIVTSGDYERCRFDGDSNRIHHIIDPHSGYPATQNQSVTIIGQDPVRTDILSTGFFSLSAETILNRVEADPHIAAIIVDSTGRRLRSTGVPAYQGEAQR
ncbi:MAG: FAD:protein FMN transferase [Fibrobacterota bacterium]